MHTIVLNVENDSMLNKLKEFVAGLKEGITIEKDIEVLNPNDPDYALIEETKNENNPSFSLDEAKRKLGL